VNNNNTGDNGSNSNETNMSFEFAAADVIRETARQEVREVVERKLKLTNDRVRNDREPIAPVVKRVKRVSNIRNGVDLRRVRNRADYMDYDTEDM
jgi:hypothetical protein